MPNGWLLPTRPISAPAFTLGSGAPGAIAAVPAARARSLPLSDNCTSPVVLNEIHLAPADAHPGRDPAAGRGDANRARRIDAGRQTRCRVAASAAPAFAANGYAAEVDARHLLGRVTSARGRRQRGTHRCAACSRSPSLRRREWPPAGPSRSSRSSAAASAASRWPRESPCRAGRWRRRPCRSSATLVTGTRR